MLHQRHLVCERCGREQWAAGRVIEEAERELSYRWCRPCLDEYGPCPVISEREQLVRDLVARQDAAYDREAAARNIAAAPAEELGIQVFFQGLAEHLKGQIGGKVEANPFTVGDLVIYRGSLAEHHGPAEVLDDLGHKALIRTRQGRIECNWTSLGRAPKWLLDTAARQLAHNT